MNIYICVATLLFSGVVLAQDGPLIADDIITTGAAPAPNTTAVAPPTTTAPNTTTVAPPTTTAPNTTTVAPPTTTAPAPTPKPVDPDNKPKLGSYNLNKTGSVCVLLEMAARLTFKYNKTDGNKGKVLVDVPADNFSVDGYCTPPPGSPDNSTQLLQISFHGWTLAFLFNRSAPNNNYDVVQIALSYTLDPAYFPNATTPGVAESSVADNLTQFKVALNRSFTCQSELQVNQFKGGELSVLTTWDVHVQAYRNSDNTTFSVSVKCDGDETVNNLVPIIVGAALAGLVLIVLVAYLIGRQRNKRGYQSV